MRMRRLVCGLVIIIKEGKEMEWRKLNLRCNPASKSLLKRSQEHSASLKPRRITSEDQLSGLEMELQRLQQREQKERLSMMKRHGTCPPVGANIKKAPAKWLGFGEIMSGWDTKKGIRHQCGKLRRAISILNASDVIVIVFRL